MHARPLILIVEDEPAIADTLLYALKTEGFAPEWCSTGRAGLAALAAKPFALVVLDVGLPDGSGFDVCKQIRAQSPVPVIFLTARNAELDRVLGLELGGGDYLVKPFSPRELTARVKAILRRTGAATGAMPGSDCHPLDDNRAGASRELAVDDERCAAMFRGVALGLTRYEFRLLMALVLRDVRLRYVESMRRTLGDTAAFLATFAAGGAAAGEDWPQRFAMLPTSGDLLRVFVSDPAGRVLFDSANGRDVGQTYDWSMRGGGRIASENYSVANVAEVGNELRVRAPVRRDRELIGWVGVGRPLSTMSEGISRARRQLFWYSGAIAAVMVAAGWWIASKLTHSLERLTDYAVAVRRGQRVSPPTSRAKEVAALGQAFEEMRVNLEGKARVERYTQALAQAGRNSC